ncbi:LysR family transcriptional regulator [Celerinatantimonas yamalensis]|uniref:LysR family transcriptional regulator n=1 Tax=Celerinatantimonas yamalensis TaxID=559956 RepID=A0ABW9G4H3_9GAMM
MNIKNLKAFVAVVQHKGFTQAAALLYLSQSAVSKAVKSLEDELKVVLINRKTSGITLTFIGEIVYQRAITLLLEVENLSAEINEFKGMIRGVLRIGLPPVASGALFASMFTSFCSMYPNIEIELIERGGSELLNLLKKGEIEIAATLRCENDELDFLGMRCEPLWLILDKANPLINNENINLSQLKGLPFILFEKGFSLNRIIINACEKRGFYPKISARSAQIDFIVDLVAAKLGIAFLPDVLAQQYAHKDIFINRLDENDLQWDIGLAWKKKVELSPAAKAWIQLAKIYRQVN